MRRAHEQRRNKEKKINTNIILLYLCIVSKNVYISYNHATAHYCLRVTVIFSVERKGCMDDACIRFISYYVCIRLLD